MQDLIKITKSKIGSEDIHSIIGHYIALWLREN